MGIALLSWCGGLSDETSIVISDLSGVFCVATFPFLTGSFMSIALFTEMEGE